MESTKRKGPLASIGMKEMIKRNHVLVAATASMIAMSGFTTAALADGEPTEAMVTAAIADAKAAQKAANAARGEWRDVGKFIKNAEKSVKAGDLANALKLAKKAKFQSEAGVIQSAHETKVATEFPDYFTE